MTKTNELYGALHRLNRQMHRAFHREVHGAGGLHHGQGSLLLLILQNDGASQRDLAELMDVRPSSMTEMLTKLEQSGLIARKQDEADQRVTRIYLTEKGKAAAEGVAEGKDAFAESFFRALTEEEQRQLLALIEKLCAGLEADEDSYEYEFHGHRASRRCGHGMYCENGMHGRGHGDHHRHHRRYFQYE
jgi:DNA-binding MarR family transcriptional regulator